MKNNQKKCNRCKEIKDFSEFHKDKRIISGLQPRCKNCLNKKNNNYFKTKKGLISRIYGNQKLCSKWRGYALPWYTNKDLKDWLFAQPKFHHLFHLWEISNYDKMLIPSVDRINDYESYTFSNIQLMTWRENQDKAYRDVMNGVNNKHNREVKQYSKEGVFISKYHSANEAERQTKVCKANIRICCNKTYKTAGGFVWRYTDV